ncbi:ion channel protein [Actinomadura verrucosospora]|uniref:Cl-channel voltage-gated family protein n=1 Tax=Actinomadura verrucosospora TaxID=46165 RepID=A0A7D3VVA1_ACTVE|nr:ion channel protein [Actinomadura verrucosospora]QKG23510.1 Cl-channel voltage-gated family protein [Actinomadura verrucosospora]
MAGTAAIKPAALLALALPALLIGIVSSLLLLGVSTLAEALQKAVWDRLPHALGIGGEPAWWTFLILVLTGVAVGFTVAKVPGHAGPDPATEGLVAPPIPARVVPGLLLAAVLTLAGGVSLGPENPITAVNIALAFALGTRLLPRVPGEAWVGLAAAGTIGALFGTPVAAALILSETAMGKADAPLWDRLLAPLISAGAGALTTVALAAPVLALNVPAAPRFTLIDLVSGAVIALAACALGLVLVYALPHVHAAFHGLPGPAAALTAGGVVLGVLGVIGGRITLFKGLDQMKTLTEQVAAHSTGGLLLIVLVKLAALLIAAACGFRGGRIFPAVFTGVAIGLLANRLVHSVPESLAIGAGLLGLLVALTRQGWLSLFLAVTVVGDIKLLPLLCVLTLPPWLLAMGRPEMLVKEG